MLDALRERFRPAQPPMFPPPPRDDRYGLDSRLPADELQKRRAAEDQFLSTRPKHACRACRASDWEPLRSADSVGAGTGWRCRNCHRKPMDEAEWNAELRQRRELEAEEAKVAAANGTPAATRAALKAAIERRAEALGALERLEAATGTVNDGWEAANRARDAAASDLAAARSDGERLVAAIVNDPTVTPSPSRTELQRRLDVAAEGLAGAREVRKHLEERIAEARRVLTRAEGNVRKAAVAVIAVEGAKTLSHFLGETEKLAADLADRRAALDWAVKAGIADAAAAKRVASLAPPSASYLDQ
ncbi:MAG TPA: hypothetical protein VFC56_10455, partial [Stellaceae bacterium]|nr:hypothetical protein [Stellaceae bacterium]